MKHLRSLMWGLLVCLGVACEREHEIDIEEGSPLAETMRGEGEVIAAGLDGGFVMLVDSRDSPEPDVSTLVKLNDLGARDWTTTLPGLENQFSADMIVRSSGTYMTLAIVFLESGGRVMQLTEVSQAGVVLRSVRLDSLAGYGGSRFVETADGGFMVVGSVSGLRNFLYDELQMFLLKLNDQLEVEWLTVTDEDRKQEGADVAQTADGGYMVLSRSTSTAWLFQFDSLGTLQWSRELGGAYPSELLLQEDGTALVAMLNFLEGSLADPMVMKVNAQGGTIWDQTYSLPHKQRLNTIAGDGSGGFYLAGGSSRKDHFHGTEDAMLWHIDGNGNLLEEEKLSPREDQQYFKGLAVRGDGRMALCGTTWGWGSDERKQVYVCIR